MRRMIRSLMMLGHTRDEANALLARYAFNSQTYMQGFRLSAAMFTFEPKPYDHATRRKMLHLARETFNRFECDGDHARGTFDGLLSAFGA